MKGRLMGWGWVSEALRRGGGFGCLISDFMSLQPPLYRSLTPQLPPPPLGLEVLQTSSSDVLILLNQIYSRNSSLQLN